LNLKSIAGKIELKNLVKVLNKYGNMTTNKEQEETEQDEFVFGKDGIVINTRRFELGAEDIERVGQGQDKFVISKTLGEYGIVINTRRFELGVEDIARVAPKKTVTPLKPLKTYIRPG
jgi:hypothetical protein